MTPRPRTSRTLATLLLAAGFLGTLSGCASAGPSLPAVQQDLQRQLPAAHFHPETRLSLGRFTLGLARKIGHLALDEDDEDEGRVLAMLDSVRRVEVGVYELRLSDRERSALTVPASLERALRRPEWETLVALREEDERVWILAEQRAEELRSLWIVYYDGEELGLVHLEGRLDRLLQAAFEEDPEAATALLLNDLL